MYAYVYCGAKNGTKYFVVEKMGSDTSCVLRGREAATTTRAVRARHNNCISSFCIVGTSPKSSGDLVRLMLSFDKKCCSHLSGSLSECNMEESSNQVVKKHSVAKEYSLQTTS